MADQALGLDVGGTKILAVRTDGEGTVLARAQVPTPAEDAEATLAAMVEVARGIGRASCRERV